VRGSYAQCFKICDRALEFLVYCTILFITKSYFSEDLEKKWSENFDERPHRPICPKLFIPAVGEPILNLKPCIGSDVIQRPMQTYLQPFSAVAFTAYTVCGQPATLSSPGQVIYVHLENVSETAIGIMCIVCWEVEEYGLLCCA